MADDGGDDSQSGRPRPPSSLSKAAIEVGSGVVGAAAGLLVAGAGGALVAGGLSPLVATTLAELQGHRFRRVQATIDSSVEMSATTEADLLAAMLATPVGAALLAAALEGAAKSVSDEKIALFARAIANGSLRDDTAVDTEFLFVRAFADFELPHFRVLERMYPLPEKIDGGDQLAHGRPTTFTVRELRTTSPVAGERPPLLDFTELTVEAVLGTLQGHGAVVRVAPDWGTELSRMEQRRRDNRPPGGITVRSDGWRITMFGEKCVDRVRRDASRLLSE